MIMVARNCRRIDVTEPGETIPDRFALAVLERGAFDLRGRRGRSPGKSFGKGIAMTVAWPSTAQATRRFARELTGSNCKIHDKFLFRPTKETDYSCDLKTRNHLVAKNAA